MPSDADVARLLEHVERSQGALEQAQAARNASIRLALAAGATYGEIGQALGMSRQGARRICLTLVPAAS